MKTSTRIAATMALGTAAVIGACLTYAFSNSYRLVIDQVRARALLVVATFEPRIAGARGTEVGGRNLALQGDINALQQKIPDLKEINVYLVSDHPSVVASTEPDQVGKPADPEDVEAAQTGQPVVLFGNDGGRGYIDVTAPLHDSGSTPYVMGIQLDIQEDLSGLQRLLWQTIGLGAGATLAAVLVILFVLSGMRRALGGEPEDLRALVTELALGKTKIASKNRSRGVHATLLELAEGLDQTSRQLIELASGDFRVEVVPRSDDDALARSMKRLTSKLGETLAAVHDAAREVAAGAQQVGNASQSVAQNSTEQATRLSEVARTVVRLSQDSSVNAQRARQANALSSQALATVSGGVESVETLVKAMTDIENSSKQVRQIVKTIDDIAFQTNLLAVNAHVESARAGSAGRGFAVVAAEVRSLSNRSSVAVRETTTLVNEVMASIQRGQEALEQVRNALTSIEGGTQGVVGPTDDSARESVRLSEELSLVEKELGQIDEWAQSNVASIEATASAAQELSEQASRVEDLVGQFHYRRTDPSPDDV